MAELQALSLDLLQLALDLAGIVEPTPIADGTNALIALGRGQWLDAALSGLGIIPYIGDLAKAGKLPRYLRSLEKASKLADNSRRCAEALRPAMTKLYQILDRVPNGINTYIDRMKRVVRDFLQQHHVPTPAQASRPPASSASHSSRGTPHDVPSRVESPRHTGTDSPRKREAEATTPAAPRRAAQGGPLLPPMASQKQAGHVRGTPQYQNRIKQGKPTSAFDDAHSAEQLTQEAWAKGTPVPGRPNVREHDFGDRIVGTGPNGGTQTRVRVHQDAQGRIHGHPAGPETTP